MTEKRNRTAKADQQTPVAEPCQAPSPIDRRRFFGGLGLLAVGGNLAPDTLISAYSNGIFPWYNDGQPLLWWCPDPRTVLYPRNVHISRSLAKSLKRDKFRITCDLAFDQVIRACAGIRNNNP